MFKELSDELLEKVSGGDVYYFHHKNNSECEYGSNCVLRAFPWVVSKDGQKINSKEASNGNLCFCSSRTAALEAQKRLNKDSKILKIRNIVMDERMHEYLCDAGICYPI